MEREYTRKEFYDLVWSQPMRTIAQSFGISDVALAKKCRKADIPVPNRGYWARKQAGRPVTKVNLPPRFPGASDRFGRDDYGYGFYGSDWPEKWKDVSVPTEPTFDEEMDAVEVRARAMVSKVRVSRSFDPVHPLVAKLLAQDEAALQDQLRWNSSYDRRKYHSGIERRRLHIINALFMAAARLGCRAGMNTSRYRDEPDGRELALKVGDSVVDFSLEPIKGRKEGQADRLRLRLGSPGRHNAASLTWEDDEGRNLESQLTEILVEMLVEAERIYRAGLVHHREWVIERKAAAEKELQRRKDEVEREARELEERLARERIARLLSQAKALDRANQIRAYVDAVLARPAEFPGDIHAWAGWARQEADRIDPLKNGTIAKAVGSASQRD